MSRLQAAALALALSALGLGLALSPRLKQPSPDLPAEALLGKSPRAPSAQPSERGEPTKPRGDLAPLSSQAMPGGARLGDPAPLSSRVTTWDTRTPRSLYVLLRISRSGASLEGVLKKPVPFHKPRVMPGEEPFRARLSGAGGQAFELTFGVGGLKPRGLQGEAKGVVYVGDQAYADSVVIALRLPDLPRPFTLELFGPQGARLGKLKV